MTNTATNFSYFMPRHHFSSIETREIYPPHIRPGDPELSGDRGVDKAMTMLNIAEDQIVTMIAAEPFNPSDFGFTEHEIQAEGDFDMVSMWVNEANTFWISPGEKPMTYEITKLSSEEGTEGDEDTAFDNVKMDWEITAFVPNKVTGAILLQSLGVIELLNPTGTYLAPEQVVTVGDTAVTKDALSSLPVKIYAPIMFTDPKEVEAFLIKEGIMVDGKQAQYHHHLHSAPLEAMSRVRFIIEQRDSGAMKFEGVETAIQDHPAMTPHQKLKMLMEWRGEEQHEGSEAPVTETAAEATE